VPQVSMLPRQGRLESVGRTRSSRSSASGCLSARVRRSCGFRARYGLPGFWTSLQFRPGMTYQQHRQTWLGHPNSSRATIKVRSTGHVLESLESAISAPDPETPLKVSTGAIDLPSTCHQQSNGEPAGLSTAVVCTISAYIICITTLDGYKAP
jgi:hypothetical protein